MGYFIEYATICNKGLVRSQNQDNFWCLGHFLESENSGTSEIICGIAKSRTHPAFAVFDGMGGEQQGEVAAHIAARSFNLLYQKNCKKNMAQFLSNSCLSMNQAICNFADMQPFVSMGSTAAILMFGKSNIGICNVGDSRIYRFSDNSLMQLSCDHNATSIVGRKPSLTQNLGIHVKDFLIEPHIANAPYKLGDKYLICSDGLTDMLSDKEIYNILSSTIGVADCAQLLMQAALGAGGHDNITIILCKISKATSILNLFKVG